MLPIEYKVDQHVFQSGVEINFETDWFVFWILRLICFNNHLGVLYFET